MVNVTAEYVNRNYSAADADETHDAIGVVYECEDGKVARVGVEHEVS